MNQKFKTRWVEALRSGKYLQGHGQLLEDYPYDVGVHYCCLGVLCVITGMPYHCEDAALPKEIMKAVGLDSPDPTVPYNNEILNLSILNDVNHLEFPEIADLIEKYL